MLDSKTTFTTAIILAAGNSSRLGKDTPKQLLSVAGKSVLHRSVEAFYNCNEINRIVVVTRPEDIEYVKKDLHFALNKIHAFVFGGSSRLESATLGFKAIPYETDFIAIHDAARCLITENDIRKVLNKAYQSGAATAVGKINDTVKRIEEDKIVATLSRDDLALAQTPQVFLRKLYEDSLKNGAELNITDDNMLLELNGIKVGTVVIENPNLKITTAADLEFAEYLIQKREDCQNLSLEDNYRIGHGYDVHRLVEGRKLILGGVTIPCERGLLGHSDADVLLHAIIDSLLGAMALGDIGNHFPDSSDEYKDISSLELLKKTVDLMNSLYYEVVNIDSTVILQSPKIAGYIPKMKINIAKILGVSPDCINVKATTEEGLGFTGRGEGIKSEAIALLKKRPQ